jgi:hypothetical protein
LTADTNQTLAESNSSVPTPKTTDADGSKRVPVEEKTASQAVQADIDNSKNKISGDSNSSNRK